MGVQYGRTPHSRLQYRLLYATVIKAGAPCRARMGAYLPTCDMNFLEHRRSCPQHVYNNSMNMHNGACFSMERLMLVNLQALNRRMQGQPPLPSAGWWWVGLMCIVVPDDQASCTCCRAHALPSRDRAWDGPTPARSCRQVLHSDVPHSLHS